MTVDLIVVLTIIGSTVAILGAFSKVVSVFHQAKLRDAELTSLIESLRKDLSHQSDKIDLLFNGLKERIEHINLRLGTQIKESGLTLNDVENYLQKNTPYERRVR